jgi:hypothetical protein
VVAVVVIVISDAARATTAVMLVVDEYIAVHRGNLKARAVIV